MANLILPLLLFVGMYMLLIRPQQKKLKEQQALIASASAGDRILMTSGVYGTITEVLSTSIYVELAEGFEILVNRQSVQEILDEFPLDEVQEEIDEIQDKSVADTDDNEDADDSEDAEA